MIPTSVLMGVITMVACGMNVLTIIGHVLAWRFA